MKDKEQILCKAIKDRRLVRFYYESDSSGKKEWRTVEPYIVGIKDKGKGNAFLAALPINELAKPVSDRNTGHYLLSKLDMNRFENPTRHLRQTAPSTRTNNKHTDH